MVIFWVLYGIISVFLIATATTALALTLILSLPTPLGRNILILLLTTLTPILNFYIRRSPTNPGVWTALHTLLVTILTTLSANTVFSPTDIQNCILTTHWQRLYRARDGDTVRKIQDWLQCCGLMSPRDMAWPFGEDRDRCRVMFGRETACLPGWRERGRWWAGVEVGVLVSLGVIQVLLFIFWNGNVARKRAGDGFERMRYREEDTSLLSANRSTLGDGDESSSDRDEVPEGRYGYGSTTDDQRVLPGQSA